MYANRKKNTGSLSALAFHKIRYCSYIFYHPSFNIRDVLEKGAFLWVIVTYVWDMNNKRITRKMSDC